MQVYTYSEARQKLAEVLAQAESTGKVVIRRKDGRTFALVPEKTLCSPLDVPSIKADLSTQEIVDIIREGREKDSDWRSIIRYTVPETRKGVGNFYKNLYGIPVEFASP